MAGTSWHAQADLDVRIWQSYFAWSCRACCSARVHDAVLRLGRVVGCIDHRHLCGVCDSQSETRTRSERKKPPPTLQLYQITINKFLLSLVSCLSLPGGGTAVMPTARRPAPAMDSYVNAAANTEEALAMQDVSFPSGTWRGSYDQYGYRHERCELDLQKHSQKQTRRPIFVKTTIPEKHVS
eukprot:6460199-Amphidinium_carterae.1